jgi:hypothetical protein
MFNSIFAEGLYSLLCWIVGFVAAFRTDWVVTQALAMERRFPKALSSRIAERSWYPTFVRIGGVLCLFFGLFSSLETVARLR